MWQYYLNQSSVLVWTDQNKDFFFPRRTLIDVITPGSGAKRRVNMAASFLCRVSGVFYLRRATTRLTWTRFYSDAEPEPLTLRQQSDGIRYPDRGCHVNAVSEIKFLYAKFVIYRKNSEFTNNREFYTTRKYRSRYQCREIRFDFSLFLFF